MRKYFEFLTIFIFFLLPVFAYEDDFYKVVNVVDGDTFYVDFNKNNFPDAEERVRVNGIDTMETRINRRLKYQLTDYNLTKKEALGIGFLAKQFAEKELLNKYVKVIYSANEKKDNYNRYLVSVYYDCDKLGFCKNYEKEILKSGLAVVYQKSNLAENLCLYENIDKLKKYSNNAKKLKLVFLDKKKKEYHNINCNNVENLEYYELVKKPITRYKKARCCKI